MKILSPLFFSVSHFGVSDTPYKYPYRMTDTARMDDEVKHHHAMNDPVHFLSQHASEQVISTQQDRFS